MTEELRTEYILNMYEELTTLNDCEHIILVREKATGLLFVKKFLAHFEKAVYETLKELAPPGIPKVYHVLTSDSSLILIEEFINGQTLQSVLQNGPLSASDALTIFNTISHTLTILHSLNPPIIHRDIKAGNILITEDKKYYLIDFNAARNYDANKTNDTVILGTQGYAPPEQYGFAQTDCRSDLYSLAVLLHVMLTGKYPKDGLSCQNEINTVLKKALSLSPEERFRNIEEFTNAVHRTISPSSKDYAKIVKHYLLALPGIRSRSLVKTWGFLLGCIVIIWVSAASTLSPMHPISNRISKFFAGISLFCMYFLCTDYCHMRNYFPGTNHQNRLIRYCIITVYCFLFLLSAALLSGLFDILFP